MTRPEHTEQCACSRGIGGREATEMCQLGDVTIVLQTGKCTDSRQTPLLWTRPHRRQHITERMLLT
jgi:hypothetical protein